MSDGFLSSIKIYQALNKMKIIQIIYLRRTKAWHSENTEGQILHVTGKNHLNLPICMSSTETTSKIFNYTLNDP